VCVCVIFLYPPVFSAPAGGDAIRISWRCLIMIKLEWLGYRVVKKLWQYVKRFSSNTGTWRTDRQTERQTDRIAISISRVSVLTRGKNWTVQFDIRSDSFAIETAICLSNKTSLKVTLLALNVQIKNVLKHDRNRVYHTDFVIQLHYLLVVIVVSDVKVMSSTVTVIFAVWVVNK